MISVARGAARIVRAAVLEVRVHASLLRGQSVGWIIFKQGFQQVASSLVEVRDERSIGPLPLGEGGLVVRERGDTGPGFFVGGTEDTSNKCQNTGNNAIDSDYPPEDLEDFVNLRVTWEKGLPRAHLSKNAPDGPHIDTS